jgi:hypothetical protein
MTETPADPTPADTDPGKGPDAEADDAKAKFRAALDRKQGRTPSGESHAEGTSKAHGPHASAQVKREFRRKSGG